VFLSRNLDQNMPKNGYYLEKITVKTTEAPPRPRWPPAPNPR